MSVPASAAWMTMLKLSVPDGTLNGMAWATPFVPRLCTRLEESVLCSTGRWQVVGSVAGPAGEAAATTFGALTQLSTHVCWAARQIRPCGHAAAVPKARQPFASAVQVWTCVPEHCVAPAGEQVLLQATQAFVAALQNCWAPQEAAADQARHPLAPAVHVWTWLPAHWVAPARWHWLLH